MARDPKPWEMPDRLLADLLKEWRGEAREGELLSIANAASLPYLFRSDEEHRACGRIIRMVRRVLAKGRKRLTFNDYGYTVEAA